jgi:hypothetical protein
MLESSEGLADWTKHHIQEIQGIHPHVSVDHPISQPNFGHLSLLHSHYRGRSQKTTTPSSVDWVGKLCFYVGTVQTICLFSDDFYFDSALILTTVAVK